MRVLVAEDEPATRMLLTAAITALGHECIAACDGEAAWAAFLEQTPDVVVTDRRMPVADGLELCRRIRSQPHGQRVSILLVTAADRPEEVLAGIEAGADDYLVKPVEPFVLKVRLTAAERVAALHRQLGAAAAELARRNAELAVTARTDALTGVGNRRRFEEDLEGTHAEFTRGGWSYAVALLDVDHFKRYNDQFGHQAGDVALREVAAAIQRCCRQGDNPYRYGGEEFAVIYRLEPRSNVAVAAERVRAAVAALPHGPGTPLLAPVTASIGVAWPSADRRSPESVVAAADAGLYLAKAIGRNRVALADDEGSAPA